ncbi:MAG: PilZ domain-containing protein [Gammaproteobacteria bacterium]|nr:PilZ domain-containing protein [Gammaproteobacteria bacterium]
MTEQHAEKRRDTRFPAEAVITVSLLVVAGGPVADDATPCGSGDISLRGARLELTFVLQVNDSVMLEVQLRRDGQRFQHSGRVAWCRAVNDAGGGTPGRYNAGIEFTTPPGPALNEWRIALFGLFE